METELNFQPVTVKHSVTDTMMTASLFRKNTAVSLTIIYSITYGRYIWANYFGPNISTFQWCVYLLNKVFQSNLKAAVLQMEMITEQ